MALEPGGARGLTLAQAIPEALMQYLFLAGRVLYGGFFLLAGIDHFRHVQMMTPYAAAKGIPAPRLAVLGSGSLIILGGLSVLLGVRPTSRSSTIRTEPAPGAKSATCDASSGGVCCGPTTLPRPESPHVQRRRPPLARIPRRRPRRRRRRPSARRPATEAEGPRPPRL